MKDSRLKSDYVRFKAINPFLKGREILDIGSTEGHLHCLMVQANPSKNFYTLDLGKNADFVVDLNKPRSLNKKFDTIVAGEVIEHMECPIQFVRYCKSLLKPKGRLIITTPNAIGLQYIRNEAWCVHYVDYRGHRQAFTMPMLQRICEDEKMKVIHSEYVNAFWIRNPLEYVSYVFKKFRPDLMTVAETI